jgi:hypothetical protein
MLRLGFGTMLDTRALLLAAAAMGLSVVDAQALTPLTLDLAVDPSLRDGPSEHAMLAPRAFERPADEAYEPTARVTNHRARLQCVPFARDESGVALRGDASTWWSQAAESYVRSAAPQEKSVLVLRGYADANRGHVAVVREMVSPRLLIVDHANWLNTGEITRDVPVRDVSEAGDWSQVQVWNVPGRHWGGRKYNVQGFILGPAAKRQDAAEIPLASG